MSFVFCSVLLLFIKTLFRVFLSSFIKAAHPPLTVKSFVTMVLTIPVSRATINRSSETPQPVAKIVTLRSAETTTESIVRAAMPLHQYLRLAAAGACVQLPLSVPMIPPLTMDQSLPAESLGSTAVKENGMAKSPAPLLPLGRPLPPPPILGSFKSLPPLKKKTTKKTLHAPIKKRQHRKVSVLGSSLKADEKMFLEAAASLKQVATLSTISSRSNCHGLLPPPPFTIALNS